MKKKLIVKHKLRKKKKKNGLVVENTLKKFLLGFLGVRGRLMRKWWVPKNKFKLKNKRLKSIH